LGYLLWREVLTAVHDQRGAGVIYAHTPGDKQLTDLLRRDYHRAAVEIAETQHTRMALWGVVNELQEQIYVNSYLTLLPDLIGDQLSLNLSVRDKRQQGFAAEVGRSRYNFAMVRTTRDQLFGRVVVTRQQARLTERPDPDAAVIREVPKGTALQAVNMSDRWFEIQLPDGGLAWIDIDRVEVPPREVYANRTGVNIRTQAAGEQVLRKTNLKGNYRVLNMRYVPHKGVWYQLQLKDDAGWVAAWLVEPRFSLPAVYFMAGLQRYQLKNYSEARKAFQQFIDVAGDSENNVNLAGANAMLGASILMSRFNLRAEAAPGLEAIQRSVALTPYDPAVYNLRAVARLVVEGELRGTIDDLQTSLKLDRTNTRALGILDSVDEVVTEPDGQFQRLSRSLRIDASDKAAVELLKQQNIR
jgi:tetratricopeptide (TPR) repeat protein